MKTILSWMDVVAATLVMWTINFMFYNLNDAALYTVYGMEGFVYAYILIKLREKQS